MLSEETDDDHSSSSSGRSDTHSSSGESDNDGDMSPAVKLSHFSGDSDEEGGVNHMLAGVPSSELSM